MYIGLAASYGLVKELVEETEKKDSMEVVMFARRHSWE